MAKMDSSRREALTLGLCASGLAGLVGSAFGKDVRDEPPPPTDQAPAAASPLPALKIGVVRMTALFKGYEKVAAESQTFKTAVMAKKRELIKIQDRAKQEAGVLETLTPGSSAHTECEARIKKLKDEHEALREKCEAEFTQREAEMLQKLYKEIQWAVGVIAQERGLTLVLRQGEADDKVSPNTAMAAIERTVVYVEPSLDITREVIAKLNRGE
jgi:outer membrane protein